MAGSSVGADGAEIAGARTGASRFTALGAGAAKGAIEGAASLGDAATGNCGEAGLGGLAVPGGWTAGSGR